jgi:CheY-like chemotaxis protein
LIHCEDRQSSYRSRALVYAEGVFQCGGFVWVYSELGKGTTFKIYLPRDWGEADPCTSEVSKDLVLKGSKPILVVEDEDFVLEPIARILRGRGYSVLEASKSEEALRLVQEHAGKIHLVLTYFVLPDRNGRMLSTQIEALRPGIKTLFISGYPQDAIVHHSVLDAKIAFLPKPFGGDSLARKVREVLDSGI